MVIGSIDWIGSILILDDSTHKPHKPPLNPINFHKPSTHLVGLVDAVEFAFVLAVFDRFAFVE